MLRLTVPFLVIHGEGDFVLVDVAAHVAYAIPGIRLVVLEHCGHFALLEAPDAVVGRIRRRFAY